MTTVFSEKKKNTEAYDQIELKFFGNSFTYLFYIIILRSCIFTEINIIPPWVQEYVFT